MAGKNKLPGIVFGVEYSALTIKRGVVHLGATVEDEDLWRKVLKKLNGLKLYAGADLQQALVEVLEQDQERMREEHGHEMSKLRAECEVLRQQNSIYKAKAEQYDQFMREMQQLNENWEAPVLSVDGVDSTHGTECDREAHGDSGGFPGEGCVGARGPEEQGEPAP
jgi:hypothetical protein